MCATLAGLPSAAVIDDHSPMQRSLPWLSKPPWKYISTNNQVSMRAVQSICTHCIMERQRNTLSLHSQQQTDSFHAFPTTN